MSSTAKCKVEVHIVYSFGHLTRTKDVLLAKMNPIFDCPITQTTMVDPVIDNEGISYEREAILAWLHKGNQTSPVTRKPLHPVDLKPNLALRALIEEAGRSKVAAVAPTAPPARAIPPPIEVSVAPVEGGDADLYLVRLFVPDSPTTVMSATVINVLDNSGSMGSSCVEARPEAGTVSQLTRSDLVRHAAATEIELLSTTSNSQTNDMGVILFDHEVRTPLFITALDGRGKMLAKTVLPLIQPNGGTSIWAGLYQALTMAASAPVDHNVVILLQTDGESDSSYDPPRGIPAAFRAWLDANPAVAARITVHTIGYGFGKSLDMPLLRAIAQIGGGHCNYIPDGSMVGTVFIHNMANILSCQYRGVRIHVPHIGVTVPVGFLQGGQAREFLVSVPGGAECDFTVAISGYPLETMEVSVTRGTVPVPAYAARARYAFLRALSAALEAAERGSTVNLAPLTEELSMLGTAAAGTTDVHLINALLADLRDSTNRSDRGQVEKAFASPAAFTRWGRHYIPAVLCSHESQWPINFKDATSEIYGGPTTRFFIEQGDRIFLSVPAPKPTVSMAAVHNSAGPCFLPASLVLMGDGSRKRCDEIRAGMVVVTLGGLTRVRCVLRTEVSHADIVRLYAGSNAGIAAEGGFTQWHPVYVGGKWQHPADLGHVERVATDAIYNFVLENGHMLDIGGTKTCTLGHSFQGPVIGHPYFGSRISGKRNIRDDLEADPGWLGGSITWRNLEITHDPDTGLINGYRAQTPHNV